MPGRTGNWTKQFPDWKSACAAAGGYADQSIFEKVFAAAMQVKKGVALWERDSVLFYQEDDNTALLTSLLHIAEQTQGHLHVLDFGGALGSTYMQHRYALQHLHGCTWHVIEQPHVVRSGNEEFCNAILHFHGTMEEALAAAPINVILFSSVLQYLEKPYDWLRKAVAQGTSILIDRTPMLPNGERITVQHVPPSIYQASYACRWLDQRRVLGILRARGYTLSPWFPSAIDPAGFWGIIATPPCMGKTG